jgi:hypothetical protein
LDAFFSDTPDGMPAIDVTSFNVVTSKTKEAEMDNPLVRVSCTTHPPITQEV